LTYPKYVYTEDGSEFTNHQLFLLLISFKQVYSLFSIHIHICPLQHVWMDCSSRNIEFLDSRSCMRANVFSLEARCAKDHFARIVVVDLIVNKNPRMDITSSHKRMPITCFHLHSKRFLGMWTHANFCKTNGHIRICFPSK
jgi:hypothetical protein